jgi:hypothetical protein
MIWNYSDTSLNPSTPITVAAADFPVAPRRVEAANRARLADLEIE